MSEVNTIEHLKDTVDKYVDMFKFNVPTFIVALWLAFTVAIIPIPYEALTSMRGEGYFIITTVFTFTALVLYLLLRCITLWLSSLYISYKVHKYLEKENETK